MQTLYAQDMPLAKAGLVADSRLVKDTISRLAEDAAGARAGTLVVRGTDAEVQAVAPTVAPTNFTALGVVELDSSKEPAATAAAKAADNEYDVEQALPILRVGRIWVLCDATATITAGSAAFVRHVAAGAEVLGAFRQDADGTDAAQLTNAMFVSGHKDVNFQGDTQRIALLELNLPQA